MKRPILYIVTPFCFGILIGTAIKIPPIYTMLASLALIIPAGIFLRSEMFSQVSVYAAILLAGFSIYQMSNTTCPSHISRRITSFPDRIMVTGMVENFPDRSRTLRGGRKVNLLLRLKSYRDGEGRWMDLNGLIAVTIHAEKVDDISYGDILLVSGVISKIEAPSNPGTFNYAKYMDIRGVGHTMRIKGSHHVKVIARGKGNCLKNISFMIKRWAIARLDEHLKGRYGHFIKAIVLGDKGGVGESIKDDMVKTGTAHVLAVSGLQVGLLAGIFMGLLGLFGVPKKVNLLFVSFALIFYSLLTGLSPPVLRATIMFFVFVFGYMLNKETEIINSTSMAALIMLIYNPKLLFDPGFQLSFISIISMAAMAPKLSAFLTHRNGRRKRRTLISKILFNTANAFSVCTAAWLGSAPVVCAYFNIVSPIALAANILLVPFFSILNLLSLFFFAAASFSDNITAVLAGLLQVSEKVLFFTTHLLADMPFAYYRVASPGIEYIVLYYLLLFIIFSSDIIILRRVAIRKSTAILTVMIVLDILMCTDLIASSGKGLTVSFFDVGQADSAYIENGNAWNVLIDGGEGGKPDGFDAGRSIIAPSLWNKNVRKIDLIIITHFHSDHAGGILYILQNFDVGCVADNGLGMDDNYLYRKYKRIIKEKKIRRISVRQGDLLRLSGGADFFIFNPASHDNDLPDSNANSLVMKFVYKGRSILFAGDVTSDAIKRMNCLGELLRSDILKMPHHGSGLGSRLYLREFLENVSADICIVSSKMGGVDLDRYYDNGTGHRIRKITKNYITGVDGLISICFDRRISITRGKGFIHKN